MYQQSEKNLLNGSISSVCLYNMANFGALTSEIFWQVWDTPANFNSFRVLALLLHQRHSMEVNQTLHYVWPYFALVYYIYILGGPCPLMEFFQSQNSLSVQVLRSPKLAALLQGTPVVGVSQTAALIRGCYLYLLGWPSHWASAHILVMAALCNRGPLYFCPVISVFYLPFFPRLISAAAGWMFTIL